MENPLTMLTWEKEKRKMWEQMNMNTKNLRGIKDQYGQWWSCKSSCDSGNNRIVQCHSHTWYENPDFTDDGFECYSCYPKWDSYLNQHAKNQKKPINGYDHVWGQKWDCKPECGSGYYKGCDNICYVCMP
jgi:hypothetical protein